MYSLLNTSGQSTIPEMQFQKKVVQPGDTHWLRICGISVIIATVRNKLGKNTTNSDCCSRSPGPVPLCSVP